MDMNINAFSQPKEANITSVFSFPSFEVENDNNHGRRWSVLNTIDDETKRKQREEKSIQIRKEKRLDFANIRRQKVFLLILFLINRI